MYDKYNFVLTKSGEIHHYVDIENAVSLNIIKSGWQGRFDCILEWAEYERADVDVYTAEEIKHYFGISTFSRKEKLKKINESTL